MYMYITLDHECGVLGYIVAERTPPPPPLPHCRFETGRMLIEARQNQVRHKEHFLAVQAQRDRAEFERVLQ